MYQAEGPAKQDEHENAAVFCARGICSRRLIAQSCDVCNCCTIPLCVCILIPRKRLLLSGVRSFLCCKIAAKVSHNGLLCDVRQSNCASSLASLQKNCEEDAVHHSTSICMSPSAGHCFWGAPRLTQLLLLTSLHSPPGCFACRALPQKTLRTRLERQHATAGAPAHATGVHNAVCEVPKTASCLCWSSQIKCSSKDNVRKLSLRRYLLNGSYFHSALSGERAHWVME